MITKIRATFDRYDVIAALGLALLSAGLVWVWWPLALIIPGALLLVIGVIGAALGGSNRRG